MLPRLELEETHPDFVLAPLADPIGDEAAVPRYVEEVDARLEVGAHRVGIDEDFVGASKTGAHAEEREFASGLLL